MRDGLAADDIWIMVEDEFLATAKLFTQHLHQAEYRRLKNLARSQNASVTQAIARPIDLTSHLSTEARLRLQADAHAKVRREAVDLVNTKAKSTTSGAADEDDDDSEPWTRDTTLAGLMAPPKEPSTRLTKVIGAKSNTRTAAGFAKAKAHQSLAKSKSEADGLAERNCMQDSKSSERAGASVAKHLEAGNDGDGDDDFDAPVYLEHKKPRPADVKRVPSTTGRRESIYDDLVPSRPLRPPDRSETLSSTGSQATSKRSSVPPGSSVPSASASLSTSASSLTSIFRSVPRFTPARNDNFEDVPKRQALSGGFAERMAKRKAEAAKREREEKKKSLSLNEIPTFLV